MKLFTFMIIPVMAALFLFTSINPAQAGTVKNWELVFENNADGTVKSGSLSELVSAIRSGADVHIVAHDADSDVMVKPQRVRFYNNGSLVLAVLSEEYYNPTMTDVVHRFTTFRTDGTRDVIFQQNSGYTNDFGTMAVSWYVNR